jgi:hypothetical protein
MATTKYRGTKCPKVSTDPIKRWAVDAEGWAVNVTDAVLTAQEAGEADDAGACMFATPEHGDLMTRARDILTLIENHEQGMLDLGPASWAGADGNFVLDFH